MDNKPTYYVYTITDRDQDDSAGRTGFWTKIGAAWPHSDGKGLSISVEAMPLNGRLVLRERKDEEEQTPTEAQEPLPLPTERE